MQERWCDVCTVQSYHHCIGSLQTGRLVLMTDDWYCVDFLMLTPASERDSTGWQVSSPCWKQNELVWLALLKSGR